MKRQKDDKWEGTEDRHEVYAVRILYEKINWKNQTCRQEVTKITRLAMVQRESVVSRLQEIYAADKNLPESEQLPPVQKSGVPLIMREKKLEVEHDADLTCKVLRDKATALTGT